MARQSRTQSLIESVTNAVVGLIVSYLFTYFALPLFGFAPEPHVAVIVTACYFGLSTLRSYVLRRLFNRMQL